MESLAYPEQRSVLLTVMAGLCRCSAVGAACLLLVAACAPGDGPAEAPIPSPNVTKPASPGPTASTGLTPSPSPTTAAPSPLALATKHKCQQKKIMRHSVPMSLVKHPNNHKDTGFRA